MKQSGMLTIDGKKYATPIENLIALGDLGNGTCGHVVKMRVLFGFLGLEELSFPGTGLSITRGR